MTETLPPEVTLTEQPGGVVYRLPVRDMGGFRYVGLGSLLFGLLLCCTPILPAWKLYLAVTGQIPPGEGLLWLGAFIISTPMCKGGLHLVPIGLFILAGHSVIELRNGELTSVESWGPIEWKWQRATAELHRFYVSEGVKLFSTSPFAPRNKLCVITPEWKPVVGTRNPRPMWLAPGYPRAWLLALANDLARRCLAPAPEPSRGDAPAAPTIPVLEVPPDRGDYEEIAEQPVGSAISVEQSERGLRLIVPPLGFWGIAAWWLFGGLFLCFVACTVISDIVNGAKPFDPVEVSALVAALLVGITLLLMAANVARRRAVFVVVGNTLLVEQTNLYRTKCWEWQRGQLADILVKHHPGGEEEPDYWELEIHGEGKELHLLAHRDQAELRWLATLLRRALGCPEGLVVRSPLQ